jgi:ATP phosphoribosyltransferase
MTNKLILAVPKGRILDELLPILKKASIIPEKAFFDKESRQLRFKTNLKNLDIIRVRSFDVAVFVAFGAASFGVVGKDVLMEFDHEEIYAPIDLKIGKCRLSVAELAEVAKRDNPAHWSHIRVATKYPKATHDYFAAKGIQAECIKLNGAMELAPTLGLCRRIVDLVSSGQTLKANGLVEVETIAHISSYLTVNRTLYKTAGAEIMPILQRIQEVVGE